MEEYEHRKGLHDELNRITKLTIFNNPYVGHRYEASFAIDGSVQYIDYSTRHYHPFSISKDEAECLIRRRTSRLFYYDDDNQGSSVIDGYHWKLHFYSGDEEVRCIEGWPGEEPWRHDWIREIIKYAEQLCNKDMGLKYMGSKELDEPEDCVY